MVGRRCSRLLAGRSSRRVCANARLPAVGIDPGSHLVDFAPTSGCLGAFYPVSNANGVPSQSAENAVRVADGQDTLGIFIALAQPAADLSQGGRTTEIRSRQGSGNPSLLPSAAPSLDRSWALAGAPDEDLVRDPCANKADSGGYERILVDIESQLRA